MKRVWFAALIAMLLVSASIYYAYNQWQATKALEEQIAAVMAPQPPKPISTVAQSPGKDFEEQVDGAFPASPHDSSAESSSREDELQDADLELFLTALDEESAVKRQDFPQIPDGCLDDNPKPVWLSMPGYQKGDMTDHENIARVLIKLWNQGTRGFKGGFLNYANGRVYPLYDHVLYVQFNEVVIDGQDGLPPFTFQTIGASAGTQDRTFEDGDFTTGGWKTKYPGLEFVEFKDAGYDPATFLTEKD